MKIGFDARCSALASDHEQFIRIITEGERLGFDYTTISDHIVSPRTVTAKYPYNAAGKLSAVAAGPRHEQLTAIAFFAAKTKKLRFVTSVLVVPYRQPVLTAKIISTIDILSGGRITVGVGTGWMKDEFELVGAPDFSKRGRVTDEYLAAFKSLWTEENPEFKGDYVRFSDLAFEPKPMQKPHPPLWIGGLSDPAIRRTARFGDAWYPVPNDQAVPLDSIPRIRAGLAKLRSFTEAAGRPGDSVGVAMRVHQYGEQLAPQASDGERQVFSGSFAAIVDDLGRLGELGMTSVDFRFTADTPDKVLLAMDTFQQNVIAKIGKKNA